MAVVILGSSIIVLGLVFIFPWLLRDLARIRGMNWPTLSNVGQTYAAAATLLSSFALAGVIISLVMQNRGIKISREQAIRSLGSDLARMGDDPVLRKVISGSRSNPIVSSDTRHRQRRYANQWVLYWQSLYELGLMNDDDVREVVSKDLFSGDVGREYWSSTRERPSHAASRRAQRYFLLIDEEYGKAIASGPPEKVYPDGSKDRPGRNLTLTWKGASLGLALLGGAAALGAAVASKRQQ